MSKKDEARINDLCDMVDKLHAKVEASKSIKSKTISVLRRLLPDWHEDADNELRHDGHVIAEITFGDVRAVKALLKEIDPQSKDVHHADDLERRVKDSESNEASKRALSEAVAAIYLADDSDYLPVLWKIVELLGGNEAADLLDRDERAAYAKYQYPPSDEL